MAEDYQTASLKALGMLRMGETIIAEQCTGAGIPIYSADTSEEAWNFSNHPKLRLHPGTIIIGARGSIGFPRMPHDPEFAATQTTVVFQPNEKLALSRYMMHALCNVDFGSVTAQQAIPMLTVRELGGVHVPLPALFEQRRIAEILDTLDEAIRRSEQIIAKLKHIKQGLLHDLLTRGIDENGELRDPQRHPEQFRESPLGRIPNEWGMQPLGEISDLEVGYAFKSEWFSDQEGTRLLRGENVGYGSPDWSDTKRLPDRYRSRFEHYMLTPGDVIVGMDRTFTKSGVKVSVLGQEDTPCLLVQRVGRFVPRKANRAYVLQLLRWPGFHRQLLAQQKGMDIPHLSRTEILSPAVPVPRAPEQGRIGAMLSSFDRRQDHETLELEKLRLLKHGLMEDLLTGRVRVTNLEAAA